MGDGYIRCVDCYDGFICSNMAVCKLSESWQRGWNGKRKYAQGTSKYHKNVFDNISSSDLYINVLGRNYNHKDKQRQTISSMVYILVQLYDPWKRIFPPPWGQAQHRWGGRVMPELKTKLKEYRAKLDMKQGDLAEKSGRQAWNYHTSWKRTIQSVSKACNGYCKGIWCICRGYFFIWRWIKLKIQ